MLNLQQLTTNHLAPKLYPVMQQCPNYRKQASYRHVVAVNQPLQKENSTGRAFLLHASNELERRMTVGPKH